MGSEVRPTQASTHHCSQRRWERGLLLSLGYPVGLVPSYGAGAWNEVRRLLQWNVITTKCRREWENLLIATGIGYIVVLFHCTRTCAQVRRTKLLSRYYSLVVIISVVYMGLSRYGAKGREEPRPAQGVIRKLSSSRALPFFLSACYAG